MQLLRKHGQALQKECADELLLICSRMPYHTSTMAMGKGALKCTWLLESRSNWAASASRATSNPVECAQCRLAGTAMPPPGSCGAGLTGRLYGRSFLMCRLMWPCICTCAQACDTALPFSRRLCQRRIYGRLSAGYPGKSHCGDVWLAHHRQQTLAANARSCSGAGSLRQFLVPRRSNVLAGDCALPVAQTLRAFKWTSRSHLRQMSWIAVGMSICADDTTRI